MSLHWVQHVDGGPRRVNHAAVSIRERFIFSFGGYCTGEDYDKIDKIDVHVYDIVTSRWTKLPTVKKMDSNYDCVPYMRYGHSAALMNESVFIFGGRNDKYGACNTLYSFDTDALTWLVPKTHGLRPAARDGHTACIVGYRMYIFGGYEEEAECFSNSIEYLDAESMTWYQAKVVGKPAMWRDFHTATAVGNSMHIFGGRGDVLGPFHSGQEVYTNTVSVFDTVKNSWNIAMTTGDIPLGRRSHTTVLYGKFIYMFGGYNGLEKKHYNEMYRLDTSTLVWSKVATYGRGPCPRRRHCCCMVGTSAVIFGGTSPVADATTDDEFSLQDHSDLYVLDFNPSLRTLCKIAVLQHKLDVTCLPKVLRMELSVLEAGLSSDRSTHG